MGKFFRRLLIAIPILWVAMVYFDIHPFRTRFDSYAWKHGDRHERGDMIDDLFEKAPLRNVSPDSVLALLGHPDTRLRNGDWYYYADLGIGSSGNGIIITFDSSGEKVREVECEE